MRILITGFEPFGGRSLNSTSLLIDEINAGRISSPANFIIETLLLPVTFGEAFVHLKHKMDEFNPDVVLSFGQAAGRAEINLEQLAVNIIDAEIKDNAGVQPQNIPVNPLGPESYLSTLPIQGLVGALELANIPVKISNYAGTYVCNYLFYKLMESNQDTLRLCGFIHVPLLPDQSNDQPTMSLEELKRALSVMLNYINY